MYIDVSATSEKSVCNDISHVSMRKWDKNSPRSSTCEDFLASVIAISGVRCYTVMVLLQQKHLQNQVLAGWMQLMEDPELGGGSKTAITTNILAQDY